MFRGWTILHSLIFIDIFLSQQKIQKVSFSVSENLSKLHPQDP